MIIQAQSVPKSIAAGACLSLLAILLGFSLGGAFGAVEAPIKKHLDDSGSAVLESVYKGDAAAKDAVVKKSWEYLKRAHMHGGAIGTGALLYSLFWLWAGLKAPGIGSTGAAKESLSFIAIPGAGLSILGLCGTIISVVKAGFSTEAAR